MKIKKETKQFISFLLIVEIGLATICALYMESAPNGNIEQHSVEISKAQVARTLLKIAETRP